jgi:hypothetical protein
MPNCLHENQSGKRIRAPNVRARLSRPLHRSSLSQSEPYYPSHFDTGGRLIMRSSACAGESDDRARPTSYQRVPELCILPPLFVDLRYRFLRRQTSGSGSPMTLSGVIRVAIPECGEVPIPLSLATFWHGEVSS